MAVSASDVALWGQFSTPTGEELALMERVLAGIIECLGKHFVLSEPMTDAQEQAVIMRTLKLWRRRKSPEGVLDFGEFGPIRASHMDPDVQMLLTPKWGFA